jgi:hypothetical protein
MSSKIDRIKHVSMNCEDASSEASPERNMLCAIIESAMRDLAHARPKIAWEAKKFFENEGLESFSFLWICDILGIDPNYIFKVILRYEEKLQLKDAGLCKKRRV